MRILTRHERKLPSRSGRNARYDWDKWTDGEIHEAVQGKDFVCEVASFVAGIHVKARQLNMKAETTTNTEEDITTVTFLFKQDPSKPIVVVTGESND